MKNWLVYLLECSDQSFYCGITNNLKRRINNHNNGRGARYTKTRSPVKLIAFSEKMTRAEAMALERKIKRQPKQMKPLMLNRLG